MALTAIKWCEYTETMVSVQRTRKSPLRPVSHAGRASGNELAGAASAEDAARNLGTRAYDRLLDLILSGTLPAGTLLQEQALADELDISRTPVREALVRLETEGLVKRHVGRLLIVREVPVREFIEILRVRLVLESEAIVLACANAPAAELSALRRQHESLLARGSPDAENQARADDALHGLIVDACENTVLAELVRNLRRRTRIFNLKSLPDRFVPGCSEHLDIVDALECRDEERARRALVTHLDNVKQSILKRLGAV